MAELALVACTKTKRSYPTHAADLYVSPLFRKSFLAALDRSNRVLILSAKHGLLAPDEIIPPYEMTLKRMPPSERKAWGERTAAQILNEAGAKDTLLFFTGDDYFQPLRAASLTTKVRAERPLGTRSLGERLRYLSEINGEQALKVMLRRFDAILRKLERAQDGGRRLDEASGRQAWPKRGLYLVFEPVGPSGRSWITRVGTHGVSEGSKSTLWNRISTHRGPIGHGGGSHRSSIFRLHLGRAIGRSGFVSLPASWGVGSSAAADVRLGETEIERAVTREIGRMGLLWLNISDTPGPRSDRAYLERNMIGLLSRANFLRIRDEPNAGWLGRASTDWRIVASGLWNLDHLFYRPDPRFLDVLESYVEITAGRAPDPGRSLAPAGWESTRMVSADLQMNLF